MEADQYTVGLARPDQVKPALALAWRVFLEFEAPEYSPEGVRNFQAFIRPEAVRAQMEQGMHLWVCCAGDVPVGMLAGRPPSHVSLLFVDKACQRRGIARRLFETMCAFYRGEGLGPHTPVTVHASPYAVEAYRRLGFAPTAAEQLKDGIRYTPMQRPLG